MNSTDKLGGVVEGQVLWHPLKLTINRKTKPNVVMYFATTSQIKVFNNFLEELIKNVKKRVKQ